MNRIYLYPKVYPTENPYISNLERSLSPHYRVVNTSNNKSGVIDLFRYLFNADIYYFNWIENIPSRKFGKIQVLVFVSFLFIAKCLRKKIIWTLHNKYSHEKVDCKWTDFMYRTMFRHSDFILTHSQAGIDFAAEKYPKYVKKMRYFIHPLSRLYPEPVSAVPVYDFLIWGTIWPYKGIIEFLKFINESGIKVKIVIAGICVNEQVKMELTPLLAENIVHLEKFLDFDEIAELAGKSKFTLFTYSTNSVLSSGSLMDSIAMGSVVIGPDAGAFRDLSKYGFVKTYNRYDDIIDILNDQRDSHYNGRADIEAFWLENNWECFGEKLSVSLSTML